MKLIIFTHCSDYCSVTYPDYPQKCKSAFFADAKYGPVIRANTVRRREDAARCFCVFMN